MVYRFPRAFRIPSTVMFFVLAVADCTGRQSGDTAEITRVAGIRFDSAGIEIIQNTDSWWTDEERWEVAELPDITIGAGDSNDQNSLFQVKGALVLSDGRIIIANGGSKELKVFGNDGNWIQNVGRSGPGPAEFSTISYLYRFGGDSLLVFDWSNQRISVFSPSLEFVTSYRAENDVSGITLPHVRAVTSSGIPIMMGARPPWVEDPEPPYGQPQHIIVQSDPGGRFDTEVAVFGGTGPLRKTVYASRGETFIAGSNGSYEIAIVDLAGRFQQLIRKTTIPEAVTASYFEDRAGGELRLGSGRILRTSTPTDPASYPDNFPFFDALHVDPEGNLWVHDFKVDEEEAELFSVFRADGQYLGDVTIPAGRTILDMGSDWLLILRKDELDIEYVERYSLSKNE
jgi:hypothetical protein